MKEDYISECGRKVAWMLAQGRTVGLDYQPGNGTRYELVLTPVSHIVAADARSVEVPLGFGDDEGAVLVSHVNGRHTYGFRLMFRAERVAESYIMEKLEVSGGDAYALRLLFEAIGARAGVVT